MHSETERGQKETRIPDSNIIVAERERDPKEMQGKEESSEANELSHDKKARGDDLERTVREDECRREGRGEEISRQVTDEIDRVNKLIDPKP